MKLFKKLNSKGFGHLEILILIVVVVVIAAAGTFVYEHNHNKAHAGGWTYIGQGRLCLTNAPACASYISYNGYACASVSALGSFVKAEVIAASPVPSNSTVSLSSYNNPQGQTGSLNWNQTYSTGWWYGTIGGTPYHPVNGTSGYANYIQVTADSTHGAYATPLDSSTLRAGNLTTCS